MMEPEISYDWQDMPWQVALIISAAFNFCVILYFSAFLIMDLLVEKIIVGDNRVSIAHKKVPNFMHCFYFNIVIYPCLVVEAFFTLFTTFPVDAAYQGDLPFTVISFFSAVFGIRLFIIGRDILLLKNNRVKGLILFVHFVHLLVVGNAIFTESAAIIAFIVITSEGELIVVNVGKMLRQLGYKRSSYYRAAMFIGCYVAILFRALAPLALLAVSLVQGRPFDMSPSSMVIFFFALIVYGVVNTWFVNSSIARIWKKKARMIEVPYANFVQEVDDALGEGQNDIPPTYQDACDQPTYQDACDRPAENLAVVSRVPYDIGAQTTDCAVDNRPREQLADQLQSYADGRRTNMSTMFLNGREEPYYCDNSAISHA